jgi:hypothetical protein
MEWLQNCGMAPQKRKSSHFLLALAFASFAAIAGILTIDARNDSYKDLSNVRGTNYQTDLVVRTAGVSQIAAKYRLLKGIDKLPADEVFKVIYSDGSSEHVGVTTPFSSMGAVPIPGTGQAAPGGPCDLRPCPEVGSP